MQVLCLPMKSAGKANESVCKKSAKNRKKILLIALILWYIFLILLLTIYLFMNLFICVQSGWFSITLWTEKLNIYKKQILHHSILTLNCHFWPKYESIIHNNASSSENVHLLFSIFKCKWYLICEYFSPDSDETTYSGWSNIMDRGLVFYPEGKWVVNDNFFVLWNTWYKFKVKLFVL